MSGLSRLLLVGDPRGLPQLLSAVPRSLVVGLVGASIRPQQHEALRAIAAATDLPLLIQPSAQSPAFEAFRAAVEELKPELLLVNSYAMRLPPAILSLAPHGGINLHGALLPRYRGASPLQAALLNCERETGVTMHVMSPGFDEGSVIAERRVPIHFDDTWVSVHQRIIAATADLLADELPRCLALAHAASSQDPTRAHYYPRRHPEDGAIDWNRDVLYLYNFIRALVHPHPGAFYSHQGRRLVLDAYMPLPRVAALKYGPRGGNRLLRGPALALAPLQPETCAEHGVPCETLDRNDRIVLVAEDATGRCRGLGCLSGLDFESRAGRLEWEPAPDLGPDHQSEALRLMLAFAFLELNLARIEAGEASADRLEPLVAAGFDADASRRRPLRLTISRSTFLRLVGGAVHLT